MYSAALKNRSLSNLLPSVDQRRGTRRIYSIENRGRSPVLPDAESGTRPRVGWSDRFTNLHNTKGLAKTAFADRTKRNVPTVYDVCVCLRVAETIPGVVSWSSDFRTITIIAAHIRRYIYCRNPQGKRSIPTLLRTCIVFYFNNVQFYS